MLTIQNYKKLEYQMLGPSDWVVSLVYEKASTYSITLRTERFPYQKVVEVSRFVEFNNNGIGHYYFFNEQGRKTHTSLTIEQIKDMDNILKALNWFTT